MNSPPRPKVLLLDDNHETAEMLKMAFQSMPFEAVVVESGLQAVIEIFEAYDANEPFSALVLDCALPRFDGFTIARIVRLAEKTGVGPRAKIGYFTAYPKTVEQSTMVEEVGAEAYWRKPEDSAHLPMLVRMWLEC